MFHVKHSAADTKDIVSRETMVMVLKERNYG